MIKILNIKLNGHPVLGNQTINFIDPNEEKAWKYISLIIGQNGAGKTQILKVITDIFISVYDAVYNAESKWSEKYNFHASIIKNKRSIQYKSENGSIVISSGLRENINRELIPEKLLVSSYTFNDKFPKIDKSDFYYYGGLKTTTNNIFLNRPSEETFRNLSNIILNRKSRNFLTELFKELDFEQKIKVNYRKRRNYKLFSDRSFVSLIENIRSKRGKTILTEDLKKARKIFNKVVSKAFSNNGTRRFQDDSINRVLDSNESLTSFLKYIAEYSFEEKFEFSFSNKRPPMKEISIKLDFEYSWINARKNIQENRSFIEHVEVYEILSNLDILSFGKFFVYRKGFFNFDEASSGEFHLLHLLCSILSNIRPNSIVLIDEPEISLHFNWQNKFFKLLEPITKNFGDCHFIIATHSHFLVSNLHKASSTIISMTRKEDDNSLQIRNLSKLNTEGWSAEQILFDVFNVASDRNYYMSLLVDELVKEMSAFKPNLIKIKAIKAKLSAINLSDMNDKDPFKKIIKNLIR